MLTKLIKIIEKENGPLEINSLCKELNIERSVLEGMLMTLRRMGYLAEDFIDKEHYVANSHCSSCSLAGCKLNQKA